MTDIKKTVTVTHEVAVLYHDSTKWARNLQEAIEQKCKESTRTRLKQYFATRLWITLRRSLVILEVKHCCLLHFLKVNLLLRFLCQF